MDPLELFHQIGWFAFLTLLVAFVPLVAGAIYAVWPTERRLALMRPFSLAALFAGLAGALQGFATSLMGIAATPEITDSARGRIAGGLSEALVPLILALSCLAVAWLLVAVGMRRGSDDR